MSKHILIKRILLLFSVLVMILATAPAAFAVTTNEYRITITPNGQEGIGNSDRFEAYCVFEGTIGTSGNQLVDLVWGHAVDSEALVAALKSDTTVMKNGRRFGEEFSEEWTLWQNGYSDQLSEAEFVAKFMAEDNHFNDPKYADEFARQLAVHIKRDFSPLKSDISGSNWVIDVPHAGYYLVKDTYRSAEGNDETDGAVSSYILQVAGPVTVELKATLPVVEKKVEGLDGYLTESYTDVQYTLTGTVSENIGEYKTYSYKFTDTLSPGLTANTDSIKVTVTANGLSVPAEFTINEDYTVSLTPTGTNKENHVLIISFNDLKASLISKAPSLVLTNTNVINSIKIQVLYTAQITDYAVIGSAGNPNVVKLEYSNNPYSDGKGETVNDEVNTYTLALRVIKQDEEGEPIKDVEFILKSSDDKYAVLNTALDDGETYYMLKDWSERESEATIIVTDEGGGFNIHGLSAGSYTLVEGKTKKGYETMKPVVFNISSVSTAEKGYCDENGTLSKLDITLDISNEKREDVTILSNDFKGHRAQLVFTNYPSPILPHTGGIGRTVVICFSALAVLAGAVIAVVSSRKKSNASK